MKQFSNPMEEGDLKDDPDSQQDQKVIEDPDPNENLKIGKLTRELNALRETNNEYEQKIDNLCQEIAELNKKVKETDRNLQECEKDKKT